MPSRPRIASVTVTPVAVPDPPLLNAAGCHEPFALRTIVEIEDGNGRVGIGEAYGDTRTVEALTAAGARLRGVDPWNLTAVWSETFAAVDKGAAGRASSGPAHLHDAAHNAPGAARSLAGNAYAALEVACLDLQGQQAGVPVAELLGGRHRDQVEFSAYLFYKFARHAPRDNGEVPPDDGWGEALDPAGIVRQAGRFVERYGFSTFKFKGGVFPPEQEVEATAALREAFADARLRLDPNAIWSVETGVRAGERLREIGLEYYEDPTAGMEGMAEVRRRTGLPTATNMCVTSFADLPKAVQLQPVGYILSDHHFWGGVRATVRLSAFCRDFGIGVSMHSNTHLGVSLAAMVHVAAAMPHLNAACDTHYPWQQPHDLIEQTWHFHDGHLTVPEAPGLGVTLNRARLAAMHADWERCGIRRRNDGDEMRRHIPDWQYQNPRW